MDIGGIRKFADRVSTRPTRLAMLGCVLVAVPLVWTARQSRLTRVALERAAVAEEAAAQARADVEQARAQLKTEGRPRKDPAVRRSRHEDPEEIARVQRLYEEIDNLTRLQDQVEDELMGMRRIKTKKAPAAPATTPARTP